MTTLGFKWLYSDSENYKIIEFFDDGSSRTVTPEYIPYKEWIETGKIIEKIAGNKYVSFINGIPKYDSDAAKKEKDIEQWNYIKSQRTQKIVDIEWRASRYERQISAGIAPKETHEKYIEILNYIQSLRDIPDKQSEPYNIIWPNIPEDN